MDETPGQERRPGGSVEPIGRGFVGKEPFHTVALPAERFELRDPFAEVTYRARTFVEMVTKANRVGAIRFTAIAPDGARSTVSKVDGTWR